MKLAELFTSGATHIAIDDFQGDNPKKVVNDPVAISVDKDDLLTLVKIENDIVQFKITDSLRPIIFEVDIDTWNENTKKL